MPPITFFSPLSEEQLNDWAMQASESLANSYASHDYSGSRNVNNYEFVASFKDYGDRISENAPFFPNDPSLKYVETRQNFPNEFASKNASLDAKIDNLEARTTKLPGQILSANTRLDGEPIFSFNSQWEEKAVSTNNFPNQNDWEIYAHRMNLRNIDNERKWGFSNREILPVEVIAEQIIPPTDITFTQLYYSNDRLNMGLFCINSYSVENDGGSLVGFQTNKAIADRPLGSDSWGLSTNPRYNSHFEWNGFLSEGTIRKQEQKGELQLLSLGVTLAVQNSLIQGNLGKILVDIKLI